LSNFAHVSLDLMLPWQIRQSMARRAVAWIPLGTIEWHCEHLPVGLDALTAHGLCLRAADRDGGVALPPLHYGTGGGHGTYPWTVMMPEATEIAAEIAFTLKRLQDFGVKLAVIFTGHFADTQLAMIDRIAADWAAAGNAMKVLATSVSRIEGLAIKPDHAGIFETTLLHALHPNLVQLDRLPSLTEQPLATDDWAESRHETAHPIWGVFGPDPRGFDPGAADRLLANAVSWLVAKAREALP
jgi:creatinine amidohydrolase